MPSVLFVCTANRFRSPLAAAFFQKELESVDKGGNWKVDSAGAWTVHGLPILPEVRPIARKYGLDLARHRSKQVSRAMLDGFDLILVMETGHLEALQNEFPSHSDRIYLLSQVAEGRVYSIPDPIHSAESMMQVGGNLHDLIRAGFGDICALAIRLQKERGRSDPAGQ